MRRSRVLIFRGKFLRLHIRVREAASGELADQVNLPLAVRAVVLAKHFVKPDSRFFSDVRTPPRVPRQVGLRLTNDEAPVDGSNVLAFRNWEDRVERAAIAAGHVL